MLKGKKIILCVTGSISAYKAVFLLRLLVRDGAEVRVILTESAAKFVSPLTFSTLSRNRVMIHLFDNDNWENHALLGRWADLILIAPASANTLAKMAAGTCDNLLLAVYLSATCQVMVAPAMDEDMWQHPAMQRNIRNVTADGVMVLDVEKGELASGLTGLGRLMEPEDILQAVTDFFSTNQTFDGKNVLITAGPTIEPIDPVRFISNHSTGKMGIALAHAFQTAGANVTVVAGPINVKIDRGIDVINVQTAEQMYNACISGFGNADIIIMTAAVADFTPVHAAEEKMKKTAMNTSLELRPTKDILAELGKMKTNSQTLVGFALETENEKQNALAKLKNKRADYIILNSLKDEGAGFSGDTNKITIFGKDGSETSFPLLSKVDIARRIVSFIHDRI